MLVFHLLHIVSVNETMWLSDTLQQIWQNIALLGFHAMLMTHDIKQSRQNTKV